MDVSTPPAPMDNHSVSTGDEVSFGSLGNAAAQSHVATFSGSQAPATFAGTPSGYSSAMSSWAASMKDTQSRLDANPLASSFTRMALGQRLSDPATTGVTA